MVTSHETVAKLHIHNYPTNLRIMWANTKSDFKDVQVFV